MNSIISKHFLGNDISLFHRQCVAITHIFDTVSNIHKAKNSNEQSTLKALMYKDKINMLLEFEYGFGKTFVILGLCKLLKNNDANSNILIIVPKILYEQYKEIVSKIDISHIHMSESTTKPGLINIVTPKNTSAHKIAWDHIFFDDQRYIVNNYKYSYTTTQHNLIDFAYIYTQYNSILKYVHNIKLEPINLTTLQDNIDNGKYIVSRFRILYNNNEIKNFKTTSSKISRILQNLTTCLVCFEEYNNNIIVTGCCYNTLCERCSDLTPICPYCRNAGSHSISLGDFIICNSDKRIIVVLQKKIQLKCKYDYIERDKYKYDNVIVARGYKTYGIKFSSVDYLLVDSRFYIDKVCNRLLDISNNNTVVHRIDVLGNNINILLK